MSQHCLFVYRRTPKLLTHRNSHQLVHRHTNRLRAASWCIWFPSLSILISMENCSAPILCSGFKPGQDCISSVCFAWPNYMRAVNGAKKKVICVCLSAVNKCSDTPPWITRWTPRKCFCGVPQFSRSVGNCFEIYGLTLVLPSQLSFHFDPKQNPPVETFPQLMIFILLAGICSGIIYCQCEGQ